MIKVTRSETDIYHYFTDPNYNQVAMAHRECSYPPNDLLFAIQDEVASMNVGHFTDYAISSDGVVSGTWVITCGNETPTITLVSCECDRAHIHTKQELLNNIPHNACGLFLSLAHPIQGTSAMEIVNLPGSGVAVFASRKINDVNISASSLLTLALVTLKNASELKGTLVNECTMQTLTVGADVTQTGDNVEPTTVTVGQLKQTQDWDSQVAKELIEAVVAYKRTNNRLPETPRWDRFVKGLSPAVQDFVGLNPENSRSLAIAALKQASGGNKRKRGESNDTTQADTTDETMQPHEANAINDTRSE